MADEEHDSSLVNSIIFGSAAMYNQLVAEMNMAFVTRLLDEEAPEQWGEGEPR